jgi:peptidoglycan/LPS O-acetylase OafA/YrhL
MSGGFVGVDVFFVISGYLMTTLLLEACESHTLSISNYYERRVMRGSGFFRPSLE